MKDELWDKCQELVNIGVVDVPLVFYQKELENNLSKEQMECFPESGIDLLPAMEKFADMKTVVTTIIDLMKHYPDINP